MDQPHSIESQSPSKASSVVAIGLAVVGLIVGFAGGYYVAPQGNTNQIQVNTGEEVQKAIQEIFGGIQVNSLAGKVIEVAPSGIIVEVPSIYGVPLPKSYQRKEVTAGITTKIVMRVNKDTITFNKELTAAKAVKGKPFVPPLPYTETQIAITGVPVGETVNITTQPINILSQKFEALQIIVRK